tara:strand:+ start:384 stop:608 length:225 start_codon:yes stop_codon:yes gene_type:complete
MLNIDENAFFAALILLVAIGFLLYQPVITANVVGIPETAEGEVSPEVYLTYLEMTPTLAIGKYVGEVLLEAVND